MQLLTNKKAAREISILNIILTVFVLGVLNQHAVSQNNQGFKIPYFDSAQYVFEGELLNVRPTEDGKMAYNIFKIHKVFKGDLNEGTVAVLTKNDRSFGLNDRPDVFMKGFIGTVLANHIEDKKAYPKINTTNSVILEKAKKPENGKTYNLSRFKYNIYNYVENPDSALYTGYSYLSSKARKAALESKTHPKIAIKRNVKDLLFYDSEQYYKYIKKFLPKFEDFTDTVWRRPQTDPYATETAEPIPDTMAEYYERMHKINEKRMKEIRNYQNKRRKKKKGSNADLLLIILLIQKVQLKSLLSSIYI